MLNATLRNIKQDSMPKNIPGLSRNRSQVTGLQSGKQRISGRRFSPPGWWSRRSDDRKYVCVRRLARGPRTRVVLSRETLQNREKIGQRN